VTPGKRLSLAGGEGLQRELRSVQKDEKEKETTDKQTTNG